MFSKAGPGPSRAMEREIKLRRSIRQVKKYSPQEAEQNNLLQRSLSERNLGKVLMRCYQNRTPNDHNYNINNNNNVEVNGKADQSGMKVGDRVVSINGVSTSDVFHSEALAAVKKAQRTLSIGLQRPNSENITDLRELKLDVNRNEANHSQVNGGIASYRPPLSAPKSPVKASPSVWAPPSEQIHPSLIEQTYKTPSVSSSEGMEHTAGVQYNEFYEPQYPKPVTIGNKDEDSSRDHWATDIIDAAVRTPAPISLLESEHHDLRRRSEPQAAVEREPSPPPDNRSSTLPRKLVQRKDPEPASMTSYDDRARTLPHKKSTSGNTVPAWYKQMYKEMHSSMEGESHLTRLLSSDAARGAFRKYDGATSPKNIRSQSPVERQRPASMHFTTQGDDNVFTSDTTEPARPNVSVRGLKSTYMAKISTDGEPPRLSRQEERQKRHSVHSTWYRQIQKGGEIPMTGLRPQEGTEITAPAIRYFSKEEGDKPEKQGALVGGKSYQKLEKSLVSDEEQKKRFEYNNPPDYLELRKRAEAEGRLQEDKERERKLIEEERERRLKEEEERKINYEMERERQRRLEEERQQRLAEDRQRRLEAERKHQEMERMRAEERRRAEEERYRQEQERFMKEQQRLEEERLKEQEKTRMELERLQREEEKRQVAKDRQMKAVNGDVAVGHAKALYSFQPQSNTELPFKKGDIIKILRQIDDNWYEGDHRGKVGIFPVAYVEPLKPSAPPALQVEEGLAKAKYSFKAESPKELSFKKGDTVTLLRKVDANWYEGEIGDKIGIFPSSYVEVVREPKVLGKVEMNSPAPVIEDAVDAPVQNHFVESAPLNIETNGPARSQGERYRVLFGYIPMNEDEVELREGDLVDVVEKCDDGWFVGTVVGTTMLGIFPGNYVIKV